MQFHEHPVPLRIDADEAIRVGTSGVDLETLLLAHKEGASPRYFAKTMDERLNEVDVYAAIAYCLRHPKRVEAYLEHRRRQYEERYDDLAAEQPTNSELHARLAARKNEMQQSGIWTWLDGSNKTTAASEDTRDWHGPFEAEPLPLRVLENGSIRIGKTRVMLELVISAFDHGASPEYIVRAVYTTLDLADVYAVIAYYLRHRDEIRDYMRREEEEGEKMQAFIESQPGHQELKDRLLKRKAEMDKAHAAAHQ
jgi:uncharacterized protein (DUF433 family)